MSFRGQFDQLAGFGALDAGQFGAVILSAAAQLVVDVASGAFAYDPSEIVTIELANDSATHAGKTAGPYPANTLGSVTVFFGGEVALDGGVVVYTAPFYGWSEGTAEPAYSTVIRRDGVAIDPQPAFTVDAAGRRRYASLGDGVYTFADTVGGSTTITASVEISTAPAAAVPHARSNSTAYLTSASGVGGFTKRFISVVRGEIDAVLPSSTIFVSGSRYRVESQGAGILRHTFSIDNDGAGPNTPLTTAAITVNAIARRLVAGTSFNIVTDFNAAGVTRVYYALNGGPLTLEGSYDNSANSDAAINLDFFRGMEILAKFDGTAPSDFPFAQIMVAIPVDGETFDTEPDLNNAAVQSSLTTPNGAAGLFLPAERPLNLLGVAADINATPPQNSAAGLTLEGTGGFADATV